MVVLEMVFVLLSLPVMTPLGAALSGTKSCHPPSRSSAGEGEVEGGEGAINRAGGATPLLLTAREEEGEHKLKTVRRTAKRPPITQPTRLFLLLLLLLLVVLMLVMAPSSSPSPPW